MSQQPYHLRKQLLNMQERAVNTRLSRGRARLRQQFLDARKEE